MSESPPPIRSSREWRWQAAAVLVALLALLLGHRAYSAQRRLVVENFQAQQALVALTLRNAVLDHLAALELDLEHVVREIQSDGIAPDRVDRALGKLHASHSVDFLSIALFDGAGELARATPSVGLWGPELRAAVREAMAARAGAGRAFLPGSGPAAWASPAALCLPFTSAADGRPYVVAGLVRFEDFMLRHLPAAPGPSLGVLLADERGRVLILRSTQHRGDDAVAEGSVLAPPPPCLRCHGRGDFSDIARAFGERGVTHAVFRAPDGASANRATVAFPAYNRHWALAVTFPYEGVQLAVDRYRGATFAVALLLGLAAGAAGWIGAVRGRLRRATRETAALRASEERFRAVFDFANDGILIVREDGTILDVNRALHERLGYRKEELLGRSIATLDDPEAAALVPERMAAIVRQGHAVFAVEHRRRDGTAMPVEISARAIEIGGRRVVLSVVRDVTERAAAERALRRYAREIEEANRLKDLFTDIVRHDLLNALSVARGYAELLPAGADSAGRDLVGSVRRALARLAELIRSAAHLSRLMETERLETQEQDLGEILAEALRPFEREIAEGGWLVELPPPRPRPIRANPLVVEVFANLVANALKFAGETRRLEIGARDAGAAWVVTVRDWGPGIAPADRERAFVRLERLGVRGTKGMGLGLAIARRVVDLHGGTMRIEDNPEGGCVFHVELPKGAPPAVPGAGGVAA